MEYCLVGECQGVFGIKGEVKVYSYTDFPDRRFKIGNKLFIQDDNNYLEVTIRTYRVHKNHVLLSFNEFPDINTVEKYAHCNLVIDDNDKFALPAGKYYPKQLIGLDVYQDDKYLGKVIDLDEVSVHSILRVKNNDKEVLIPNVKAFIDKVDLDNKKIYINPTQGLI